ncbi:hypothetical protein GCM10028808_30240 [Spirosoma migulaei]
MSNQEYRFEDEKNPDKPELYDQELGPSPEFPVRLKVTAYAVMVTMSSLLLILKLSGLIDWSWWWISLPLWLMPAGFALIAIGIILLMGWHEIRRTLHIH